MYLSRESRSEGFVTRPLPLVPGQPFGGFQIWGIFLRTFNFKIYIRIYASECTFREIGRVPGFQRRSDLGKGTLLRPDSQGRRKMYTVDPTRPDPGRYRRGYQNWYQDQYT